MCHKILLTGGGTLGSVVPLVALAEKLRHKNIQMLWLGTYGGVEREFMRQYHIPYKPISAGKWRRYFSLRTVLDPILFVIGFIQSWLVLLIWRPQLIVSAGAYVSVPVTLAADFLGIPVLVHQQDIEIGLANKIMARWATKITVSFPEQAIFFPDFKVIMTGNPVREEIRQAKNQASKKSQFNLILDLPVLLVVGGGTGAGQINKLVWETLEQLTKFCQVVHITGQQKKIKIEEHSSKNYHQFEFITKDLSGLMARADLVVSRAGMSFLAELSYLSKPTIIIPLPRSHQEKNAEYFAAHQAAEVLNFDYDLAAEDKERFTSLVKDILADAAKRKILGTNIQKLSTPNAAEKIVGEIFNLLN
jgi:UDP-N-acetylglucosamine--N-acetylmuramyl-(pentapeptide) pyrophosphoryl-undecaprenol N-acetylglucosamine transferase